MEIFWWYQTVGAVFAGNVLTVGFLYFFWVSHQRQKQGLNPYDVGLGAILAGAAAPLITLGGLWLMKP